MPARLDSVAEGVETGHKISAVYFIGSTGVNADDPPRKGQEASEQDPLTSRSDGQLVLQNMEAAAAPVAGGEVRSSSPPTTDSGSGNGSPLAAEPPRGGGGGKDGKSKELGDGNRGDDDNNDDKGIHLTRPLDSARGRGTTDGDAPPQPLGAVVDPTEDRLVLFRSDRVSTQTLEVLGRGREQYAVLFWMHAAKGGLGDGCAAAADAAVEEEK